jgi:hypothetical protein
MRIFKIIPLDSKGEQDGMEWLTGHEDVAMGCYLKGNSVAMAEVSSWQTVSFSVVIKPMDGE